MAAQSYDVVRCPEEIAEKSVLGKPGCRLEQALPALLYMNAACPSYVNVSAFGRYQTG